MPRDNYLYFFGYDKNEAALSKLESRYMFNEEEKKKVLFSHIKIDPSSSAFIKRRVDIISSSEDYPSLLEAIKRESIATEGFKVEYLVLEGDTTEYEIRLDKLRVIGFCIEGDPDYHKPRIIYILCHFDHTWYFGESIKNNLDWYKHNQKPYSYSNSISSAISKALVNIALASKTERTLLDACCGAGTIMLEACFAGYNIEGCDINWKLCRGARENLSHFQYKATIFCSDIADITGNYDAAILDLPYNLYSQATDESLLHLIKSTVARSSLLVIVSISDITALVDQAGLIIVDTCTVSKKGKANFTRIIWVCRAL